MKHVGINIKRIRNEKGMTITDLANEHVSRGMISLIENGKTQPSIERLQHIANQLDVDLSELTEIISRSEIRQVLHESTRLYRLQENEALIQAIELIQPFLTRLSKNYEAAQLYELYARCLYNLYIHANHLYEEIDDNTWNDYIFKAMAIYEDLQMDWRSINLWGFLAKIEFFTANYTKSLQLIDKGLGSLDIENSLETKTTYLELMVIKINTHFSLGQHDIAHKELDNLLQFSRKTQVFIHYYALLTMKTLLLYDQQHYSEARNFLKQTTDYVTLLQLGELEIEHTIVNIFIEQFYEKNDAKALEIADKLENQVTNKATLSPTALKAFSAFIHNLKARSYTSLGHYEKARKLFEKNPLKLNDFFRLAPYDLAVRMIWKSYAALSYHHTGEKQMAKKLANQSMDILHDIPHSHFYHFARNVRMQVTDDRNEG